LQRAQLARLRAQIAFTRRRGGGDAALLLDAAKRLEGLDDDLARETFLEALGAAIFAGSLGTHPDLREVAQAALAAPPPPPPPPTPPRTADLLLDGVATRFTAGYSESLPTVRRGLEAFRQHAQTSGNGDSRWFWLAWLLASELWDDALMDELATNAVRLARD